MTHRVMSSRIRLIIHILLVLTLLPLAGAALVGVFLLATGQQSDDALQFIACAMLTTLHLCLVIAAVYVIGIRGLTILMVLAMLVSIATWIGWMVFISLENQMGFQEEEFVLALVGSGLVVSAALIHLGLFACLRTKSILLRWSRWMVVAIANLFCLVVVFLIWAEPLNLISSLSLIYAGLFVAQVLGFLTLLGTIAVPIGVRVHAKRSKATSESVSRQVTLDMTCPKCGANQQFRNGPAYCTACKFTMMIEIEEPRCECGYLLYRLEGTTCPECGREVSSSPQLRQPSTESASHPVSLPHATSEREDLTNP